MLSAIQYAHAWVVSHLHRDERGQDLIEYALLGGLIALALMAAVLLLSGAITDMATGIGNCIDFSDAVGSECSPF
ncbi:MAG: Flp family type IVb pilin [Dehalococcoidia bacterium]|nr:Flp family type IVb pilin [Dehalococcoidia bacterium]